MQNIAINRQDKWTDKIKIPKFWAKYCSQI